MAEVGLLLGHHLELEVRDSNSQFNSGAIVSVGARFDTKTEEGEENKREEQVEGTHVGERKAERNRDRRGERRGGGVEERGEEEG